MFEEKNKAQRLQTELDVSEQVQRDFVKLSQTLQVRHLGNEALDRAPKALEGVLVPRSTCQSLTRPLTTARGLGTTAAPAPALHTCLGMQTRNQVCPSDLSPFPFSSTLLILKSKVGSLQHTT